MSFDVFKLRKKLAVRILLKSLIWAFALFGGIAILLVFVGLWWLKGSSSGVEIPKRAILAVDLDAAHSEVRPDTLWDEISGESTLSLTDMMVVLDCASVDDRIKAVAAKINMSELGQAQILDLLQVFRQIRTMGKKTYIYTSGFGALSGGLKEYVLASAFDEITVMPQGEVSMTGVGLEVPFAKDGLDKIGIDPQFSSRYEYKGAMDSFTKNRMPQAFRQNMQKLLQDLNDTLYTVAETARVDEQGRQRVQIKALQNRFPLTAAEAQKVGLIDKTAYEAEWRQKIKDETQGEFLTLEDYASGMMYREKGKKLAILFLEGDIVDQASGALQSENEIVVEDVLDDIEDMAEQDDVAGVLVRVNSPGGSYTAASEIWNALNRLKQDKKIPLYISMGDYAASGGYFIALAGDKIFAQPTTLTGSIGVFGGKFVLQNLWQKLGIHWAQLKDDDLSGANSTNFRFSERQKRALNVSLDRVYADFTRKTMESRGLSSAEIDKVARGRVWSGWAAKELHLIDEIGGFADAVSALKQAGGFADDEPFALLQYPRPKSLAEKLAAAMRGPNLMKTQITGQNFGIDSRVLSVLKRMQYNAVMPPIIFEK
jgi:protease-4